MQPNVVTLPVDEENDGIGPVNYVYTRFEEFQNRSVYIHSDHTLTAKDTLSLYRTFPKVSGNFRGVAKSSLKFSKDIVVVGVDGVSQITAPIIVDVAFSIPVGATHAQILIARQKAVALLDQDSTMTPLNEQQMV